MSDAYVIEISGEPAGIVARLNRGFAFYAARTPFHRLEAQVFRSPLEAEKAVRLLQSNKAGRSRAGAADTGR